MSTYVVINTKTREVMSTNGQVRSFFSYHSARVERDHRNDSAIKTAGFRYAESGIRERCYDWHVCHMPQGIRTEDVSVERQITRGVFEKRTVTRFSVDKKEPLRPVTRAPRTNTKAARQQKAMERSEFSASIRKTPCRIRKKKTS